MMGHENITTTEVYMHVDTQHYRRVCRLFILETPFRHQQQAGNLRREYSKFRLYCLVLNTFEV